MLASNSRRTYTYRTVVVYLAPLKLEHMSLYDAREVVTNEREQPMQVLREPRHDTIGIFCVSTAIVETDRRI